MTPPRKQHFIQRRLLQNFSNEDNMIWVHNNQTDEVFPSTNSKIALKKGLLTEQADQIITSVESECYPVIERIIEKECVDLMDRLVENFTSCPAE